MPDQATKLRRLVSRIESVEGGAPRARRIVLTGSKGGVGTSTLALGLAIALRKLTQRVLLIDANPARGNLATMCDLRGTSDIDDLLSGRQALQQTVLTGPGDIHVLPRFGVNLGAWGSAPRQLVRQWDSWSHAYDLMVVDAGNCPLTAELLAPIAEPLVLVTTTSTVAITDAYALIKSLSGQHLLSDIHCIVNMYESKCSAEDVSDRLIDSCERFLGLKLNGLVSVPLDSKVAIAAGSGRSVVSAFPSSPSSLAIEEVANQVAPVDMVHDSLKSISCT